MQMGPLPAEILRLQVSCKYSNYIGKKLQDSTSPRRALNSSLSLLLLRTLRIWRDARISWTIVPINATELTCTQWQHSYCSCTSPTTNFPKVTIYAKYSKIGTTLFTFPLFNFTRNTTRPSEIFHKFSSLSVFTAFPAVLLFTCVLGNLMQKFATGFARFILTLSQTRCIFQMLMNTKI